MTFYFIPALLLYSTTAFKKIIKEKLCILWAASGLRVKLRREERSGFVLDAFAGAIVQVLE